MPWPLITEFSRILQHPRVAFRDPALKACTVETDNLGQPRARSGNFATVYRGYRPDDSMFAIRVFNRRADLRRETYEIKSRYLCERSLACLVDFHYDERGIRSASDGQLYPLLTMDWVPGVTLFEWARDRCHEGYSQALCICADAWLHLVRELAEHRVIHGDLQHGNVLVDCDGHLKLIDYDCMAVPELIGRRNLEVGLAPYQHPDRNADTELFAELDNFSALVIYVALRALAADPQLWIKYVDAPAYDKLLFRREDFTQPESSALYRDLRNSPDEQVRDLVYYLIQLASYELRNIPFIDEVLLWCNSLDELLSQRDWDKAVQLAARIGEDEQLSGEQHQQVEEARQRVAARDSLARAIQGDDEREIQRCYRPELLDDFPAAADLVDYARHAEHAIELLEVLDRAQRSGDWRLFRKTWNSNYELLHLRASARRYGAELQRLLAADAVSKLLAASNVDANAVIEAWRYLASLGGHSTGDRLQPQVEALARRRELLRKLERRIARTRDAPTMRRDGKLVADWARGELDGCPAPEPLVAEHWAARHRLEAAKRIGELTSRMSEAGEEEIVRISRRLPPSYHPKLATCVELARRRICCLRSLRQALGSTTSDSVVAVQWQKLAELKAQDLVSDADSQCIEVALKRRTVLKSLAGLDPDLPPPELDRLLLEIWDADLLDGCKDADNWRARHDEACRRRQSIRQLEATCEQLEATSEQLDLEKIDLLLSDALLNERTLPEAVREQVSHARRTVAQRQLDYRQRLVAAMLENQPQTFAQLFDREMLREICTALPHHQKVVSRWTEGDVLCLEKIGMKTSDLEAVKRTAATTARLTWTWPPKRFTGTCVVGVCREKPKTAAGPDDVETLFRTDVARERYAMETEGVPLEIEPEWEGAFVMVWAAVDLGFQVFHSEALELGRIVSAEEKRKWSLFTPAKRVES